MTEQHPITPPPEQVDAWTRQWLDGDKSEVYAEWLAARAAQWGADQELDACCDWVSWWRCLVGGSRPEIGLRAARRPKPLSLKEQAIAELEQIPIDPEAGVLPSSPETIRRALEALPDA